MKKIKLPADIDELKSSDFEVSMTLSTSPFEPSKKIVARHKDNEEMIYIFYWDGIHYIDRLETYYWEDRPMTKGETEIAKHLNEALQPLPKDTDRREGK